MKPFSRAPEIPVAHRAEFQEEVRARTATAAWVVTWIAFLMYPPSYFMDAFFHPRHAPMLLRVRLSETAALGVLLVVQAILRRRGLAVRMARPVAVALVACIWASLLAFLLIVGGPADSYFGGLMLLLTAVLIAFPWGLLEMGLACALIIGACDAGLLLLGPGGEGYGLGDFLNANYFWIGTTYIGLFWVVAGNNLRIREFLGRKEIEAAKARSDELLLNVLPADVAEELKAHGKVDAKAIESCSILFTDFVGFTRVASRSSAGDLVRSLDAAFSRFDSIVDRHGLEKLKTIGDAYMCAGGVLGRQPDHLLRTVLAGLEMHRALEEEGLTAADGAPWRMRIGIHAGPVVAGVIGQKKFAYDLWGDTVNTASRLESAGQPRTVNLATRTFRLIDSFFEGIDRGFVPVRGRMPMAMTGVTRLKPCYSADAEGRTANALFDEHARDWAASRGQPGRGPVMEPPGRIEGPESVGPDPLLALVELTADDRDILRAMASVVTFAAGQVLVEQGQQLSTLLLIVKGLVAVRVGRDGVSIEVGHVRPGEVIGEMSFVSWEPASATVVALETVTALEFEASWMEPMMNRFPQTGMRLLHSLALVLAQRVRESNARLLEWNVRPHAASREVRPVPMAGGHEVPETLRVAAERFLASFRALDLKPPSEEDLRIQVSQACDDLVQVAADDAHSGPGLGAWIARECGPQFLRSSMLERIRTRPLGTPLDYMTSEGIFANSPNGQGLLGKAVDSWFLDGPLARPLRGCQEEVFRQVVAAYGAGRPAGQSLRMAVISCGAAPGVFAALEHLGRPVDVDVTCLDRSLSALSLAGRRATQDGMASRFTFVCEDMVGTGARPTRLQDQRLICLPTLTVPLDDHEFVALLDELHESLEPGGCFVTGLLDPPPASRWLAESLLEWRLGRWTPAGLLRLVARSAFARGVVEVRPGDGAITLWLQKESA